MSCSQWCQVGLCTHVNALTAHQRLVLQQYNRFDAFSEVDFVFSFKIAVYAVDWR